MRKPSVLIGGPVKPELSTEQAVREMAKHTPRPVIFPLSNPTSRSEAKPQDLMDWTEGRALIGTGSPFDPVSVGGKKIHIAQTNNSYIFPGLALGIIASKAARVTDTMVKAAATELVRHLPTQKDKQASLLPPLSEARQIGRWIGLAVGRQAIQDGQAQVATEDDLDREQLEANIWEPVYAAGKQSANCESSGKTNRGWLPGRHQFPARPLSSLEAFSPLRSLICGYALRTRLIRCGKVSERLDKGMVPNILGIALAVPQNA